jgi:6-pyruvoyltetrahydropterin/6-carboxytetrahydropterin synthase
MPVHLVRRYRFSASHLYYRTEWSEEENRRRFGLCANQPGHGHNYRLWVTVGGDVDPLTGFVVDLGELDALVRREVVERLDHRHLNHALAEFAAGAAIPTSENLVLWIAQRLRSTLPAGVRLVALRLAEDEDLAAEWTATDAVELA